MSRSSRHAVIRRLPWGVGSVAALAAGALTALIAGAAVAGSPTTLSVDKSATVGTVTRAVAVTTGSRPVYWLSGETTRHFLCTTSCFPIWIPVRAPSGTLTLAKGIGGKLSTLSRTVNGKRMRQLTLSGHPLYRFAPDKAGIAGGDGIRSFGGTWHVVKAANASSGTTAGTSTPTMTTTTPTTPGYTYPPGY